MTCIVKWCGFGGDRFSGVRIIGIVQAHPLSAFGAIGDIRHRSPSNNMLAPGAFMGLEAVDLDKFPSSG